MIENYAALMRARQEQIRDMLRELAEEQARVLANNRQIAESFADVFADAINGARSLKDALASVAEQLGRMFIAGGMEGLLGGFGGTVLGSLLAGARASGGPVSVGRPYPVGERGAELFVPSLPGRIVPHRQTERWAASPCTTSTTSPAA